MIKLHCNLREYDLKNDSFRTTRINSIFKAISVISTDPDENKNGILHKKNEESLSVDTERQSSNFLKEDIEVINSF